MCCIIHTTGGCGCWSLYKLNEAWQDFLSCILGSVLSFSLSSFSLRKKTTEGSEGLEIKNSPVKKPVAYWSCPKSEVIRVGNV